MRAFLAAIILLAHSITAHATETWNFAATVLTPSQSWEYTAAAPLGTVFEPKVLLKQTGCLIVGSPCLALWYSGGWDKCSVGYAESPDLTGVTSFVKYSGNPIIGQGNGPTIGGAPPTMACRKSVFFYNGLYYLIYVGNAGAGTLHITSSADGVTGLAPQQGFLAPGPYDLALANSFVLQDGGKCHVFYDASTTSPTATWQAFSATGPCPPSPTTIVKDRGGVPLPFFQPAFGTYGTPAAIRLNGVLNYWLLANYNTPFVPSDIYHECDPLGATGLQVANGGAPIITHRAPNFDQAADPWPIDLDVGAIFADEDQNPPDGPAYAQISVWKTTGPLNSISCP